VYSAADADVVPPRLVRPLLSGPSAAPGAEESLDVEIVVSPAGDVESVKLLSSAWAPAAAMTLSAVKTWSFEPASRNGAPVSYRHRMKLPRR
jgi:TonB family protein